jgi:hypothetical protein
VEVVGMAWAALVASLVWAFVIQYSWSWWLSTLLEYHHLPLEGATIGYLEIFNSYSFISIHSYFLASFMENKQLISSNEGHAIWNE